MHTPSTFTSSPSPPNFPAQFIATQRLFARLPDESHLETLAAIFPRPTHPIYLHRDGWNDHLAMGRIAQTVYPEAYETTVPLESIEAVVRGWDSNFDPPPELSDYL